MGREVWGALKKLTLTLFGPFVSSKNNVNELRFRFVLQLKSNQSNNQSIIFIGPRVRMHCSGSYYISDIALNNPESLYPKKDGVLGVKFVIDPPYQFVEIIQANLTYLSINTTTPQLPHHSGASFVTVLYFIAPHFSPDHAKANYMVKCAILNAH